MTIVIEEGSSGPVKEKEILSPAYEKLQAMSNREKRKHLLELYNDPSFQLQSQLGTTEFEQDMMDNILYGTPANELVSGSELKSLYDTVDPLGQQSIMSLYGGNELEELLNPPQFQGDYDRLAEMSLRELNEKGDWNRWADIFTPFKVPFEEPTWHHAIDYDENDWLRATGDKAEPNYLGATSMGGRNIDFNLENIMKDPLLRLQGWDEPPSNTNISPERWNQMKGIFSLKNSIFDLAKHELPHAKEKFGPFMEHPAIYGLGAAYGTSAGSAAESGRRFSEGPRSYGENYYLQPYQPPPTGSPPWGPHHDPPSHPYDTMSPQDVAGDVYLDVVSGDAAGGPGPWNNFFQG